VAGDDKYGDKDFNAYMREQGLTRMFLHSHRISFDWPNGGDFSASAPLPSDLAAVLDALAESTAEKSARRRR
jgi:23S rRNA pseudouridine955/2504/2580 synthase